MKPRHTPFHIHSHGSNANRDIGSDPGLGIIARLRDKDTESSVSMDILSTRGKRGRGPSLARFEEDQKSEGRNLTTRIQFLSFLVLTVFILGGSIIMWLRYEIAHHEVESRVQAKDNKRIVSKFIPPTQEEAFKLVKRALETRQPEQVFDCIRPGTHSPEEVISFLNSSETRDGHLGVFRWLSSIDSDDTQIEGVIVHYEKDQVSNNRIAMLVPDDSGVWKLDFDSFAVSCAPSWDEILSGRVDEAEVRVVASQSTYFNGPFLDDSSWVSIDLVSHDLRQLLPERQSTLHAYCKKGSPQAAAMEKIFMDKKMKKRVIIKIRRVADAYQGQFEITRVLAGEWVAPARPLDEKF